MFWQGCVLNNFHYAKHRKITQMNDNRRASSATASDNLPATVSIVILSFNSAKLLARAIESILNQTVKAFEIIVVDNASEDNTRAVINTYKDYVQAILLDENTGYARGMNKGFAAAHGEFFVPLNTDAVLHPTFIEQALKVFRRHAEVGVVAAEVFKIDESDDWRFWHSEPGKYKSEGGVVSLNKEMRVEVIDDAFDGSPSFKANGACPVIRRRTLEDLRARFGFAPFDTVFDTYGEDVDFAFKAWSLRWHTRFAKNVCAGHIRSYASPVEMPDKRGRLRVNLIAERYINALRHLPLNELLKFIPRALKEDLQLIVTQTRKHDFQILRDTQQAFARLARLLPALLQFRVRHKTWRSINFNREVHCQESRSSP